MKSESLFGKNQQPSARGMTANGSMMEGPQRSPPKRRTSFHMGGNSFADSNEFGLRDPTICFPILSGISALYRNNLLADDANHSKEVTVYNLFLTLAQSSPLPVYQMHLLIGFSFKRSIYADLNKRHESIHYCDIIRHAYDYDVHSSEAVRIYGNDRIPYTFSTNIQLLLMMGQVVRAFNYLDYTCELIPRIAHLHSQGITVIGLCWLMIQLGRGSEVYEMYRSYVDGLETRRVFSFFNPTNTLFVAWLKLEALMESFKKTQNVGSLVDNVPCEKEQEVLALKYYLTGESRPINMFALDSFGINTEFVCARMCFLRAQIKVLTQQSDTEDVISLLKLALQYISHGISCNKVNLKNSYGYFTSLLLKADILKFYADILGGNNEEANQLLSDARDAVKICFAFGQEHSFEFITLSAAVKWKELGFFSSEDDESGISSQLLSVLSKVVLDTRSATHSAELTLTEDLVRGKPYFMIGDISSQTSFDSLVRMFPIIAELRSEVFCS